jgi:hypothetical protein
VTERAVKHLVACGDAGHCVDSMMLGYVELVHAAYMVPRACINFVAGGGPRGTTNMCRFWIRVSCCLATCPAAIRPARSPGTTSDWSAMPWPTKGNIASPTPVARVLSPLAMACGRRVPNGAVEACLWHHRSARAGIEDKGYIAWRWQVVVLRIGRRRGVRLYNCFRE